MKKQKNLNHVIRAILGVISLFLIKTHEGPSISSFGNHCGNTFLQRRQKKCARQRRKFRETAKNLNSATQNKITSTYTKSLLYNASVRLIKATEADFFLIKRLTNFSFFSYRLFKFLLTMDPQWEFEAPQFVDFTNLDNEDEVSVILSFNVLEIKVKFTTAPNYLFYF
jgi:hypothetical protein